MIIKKAYSYSAGQEEDDDRDDARELEGGISDHENPDDGDGGGDSTRATATSGKGGDSNLLHDGGTLTSVLDQVSPGIAINIPRVMDTTRAGRKDRMEEPRGADSGLCQEGEEEGSSNCTL